MTDLLIDERNPVEALAEEFLELYRRGEAPSISEYARLRPEVSAEIRDVFPALLMMEQARPAPEEAPLPGEMPGCLSDFRILREIGRGGMGIVYEAEQLSLGRRVALKVLPQASVLDPSRLRRFRNEALAAAQLEHPHIVDVYGVGCEGGVHFYVMRYIEGQTLAELIASLRGGGPESASDPGNASGPSPSLAPGATGVSSAAGRSGPADAKVVSRSTCDTARLGVSSTACPATAQGEFRFAASIGIQAAEALEHAHQQGIVHRDIKPSNLLVDAEGRVFVCDFGLAQIGTDATLTATGDLLGTLRYMSPEQGLGRRQLIDHRTDIYSLGVTLYELVTLQPALRGEQREELLRCLASEEPPRPRRINRRVPADLETIVLKAISKEPADRYASAGDLADDLRRFLENKPIGARRPSLADRGTKWLRRHRVLSLSLVAALVAALAGMVWHTASLTVERTRTREALHDKEVQGRLADANARLARRREQDEKAARLEAEAAQREAERTAKESEAVVLFLTEQLLAEATPGKALGRNLTIRDLLQTAERILDGGKIEEPKVEAAIRHSLGSVWYHLGDFGPAASHVERAAQLRELHLGAEHVQTLRTLYLLQSVYFRQHRLDEGERLIERVYAARRRVLGEEHPETLLAAHARVTYLARRERLDEALEQYRQVLKVQRRVLGAEHIAAQQVLFNMASAYEEQGDWDAALRLLRQVLPVQHTALGPMHPETLKTRSAIASLLRQRGSTDEALREFEAVLKDERHVLGEEHPETLTSRQEVATLLQQAGRYDEALRIYEQVLEAKRRIYGPENQSTLATTANLSSLLMAMRRYDEARRQMEATVEVQRRVLGSQHRHTLSATMNLAGAFRAQGDSARALELHRQACDGFQRLLGPEHYLTLAARNNVANCLSDFQKYDEARAELQTVSRAMERTLGPDHPQTIRSWCSLADVCERSGDLDEACRLCEDVFNRRLRLLGLKHPETLRSLHWLMRLLKRTNQPQRARVIVLRLQELQRRAAEIPVEAPRPGPSP